MTPEKAKEIHGATHYRTMMDGVTPQMYYKQEDWKFNNGTTRAVWVFLSFANIWTGSDSSTNWKTLIKIE
jgi:hypothetical protein